MKQIMTFDIFQRNIQIVASFVSAINTKIPKPAIGNLFDPDKMKFNQIVRIDLKQRNDKLIIYMIDAVTIYTRATFVENKCKETVIK